MRLGARGIVVLMALTLAVGCGPAPAAPAGSVRDASAPAAPKRITAAVFSTPGTLNAMISATAGSSPGVESIGTMLNSGLTTIDHRTTPHPVLAEAVPSVENGLWKLLPDGGMEVTWKIRPNATWHDGRPFTADDVLFTFQLQQDKDLAVFSSGAYASVTSVEAPDPRTVLTRWSKPYIQANIAFGFSGETSLLPLPRHLLEGPYMQDKARFTELPFWTTDVVGTGPYKLREFVLGSHVLLDANDAFVLGRPKIDQIEVKFIRDATTVIANILAGAVEVTLGRSMSLESGVQILERLPGAKMDLAPRGAITAFPQFLNPNPPLLANVQFRRALLHGIDRQGMVDSLMFGRSSVAHSFVNTDDADYPDIAPSIVRYEYDPRQMAQMIEALGYTRGADGIYQDAAAQRLGFRVDIQGGRGDPRESAALAMTNDWQRQGIAVEPFIIPAHLTDDAEFRANYPAFDMARRGNFRWDLRRVFASEESPLAETRWRGGNRGRYMNADLDNLIGRWERAIPVAERTAALRQIINHVTDQAVLFGLFYDVDATVYSGRLQNVWGFHELSSQAWNVHEWDVK